MAKLVLTVGGALVGEYPVTSNRITIGRLQGNDIRPNDPTVSKKHAAVVRADDGVFIEDLGSTNGTLVNGQDVKRRQLRHGDVIQVGRHRLRFVDEEASVAAATMVLRREVPLPGQGLPGPAQPSQQSGAARSATDAAFRSRPGVSAQYAARDAGHRQAGGFGQPASYTANIDLTDSKQLRNLFYAPQDYSVFKLLKVVAEAAQAKIAQEISCWDGRFVVLPDKKQVPTDLSDVRLKQLSFFRASAGTGITTTGVLAFEPKVRALQTPEQLQAALAPLPAGAKAASVEALVWKLTVWMSRGRAPQGTALDEPVAMRHWPNMTRLLVTPNALRIAALWSGEARSLLNTAEVLKIPLAHVLTFYSAASAIGAAIPAKRQADFLFEPPALAEHKGRGLFGRMLDRLRATKAGEPVTR
jgi:hypothetical protein